MFVAGMVFLSALILGDLNVTLPVDTAGKSTTPPLTYREEHSPPAADEELRARFEQSVAMLHAGRYDYAVTALHRVLELAPRMPEAHVNMGYALLGLDRPDAARDFFLAAIELRPRQANAYYGLALALDGLEDRAAALGAMRSFLHLCRADDPYRTKARSAIWEWEASLGRDRTPMAMPLGPKDNAAAIKR